MNLRRKRAQPGGKTGWPPTGKWDRGQRAGVASIGLTGGRAKAREPGGVNERGCDCLDVRAVLGRKFRGPPVSTPSGLRGPSERRPFLSSGIPRGLGVLFLGFLRRSTPSVPCSRPGSIRRTPHGKRSGSTSHPLERREGSISMNQNPGVYGRKLGCTQLFTADGSVQRVTVVEAGPPHGRREADEGKGRLCRPHRRPRRAQGEAHDEAARRLNKKAQHHPEAHAHKEIRCSEEFAGKFEARRAS